VLAFDTADEAKAWAASKRRCTNPRYPQCQQLYTTLCDWEQVQSYLLDKIAHYRRKYPASQAARELDERNSFKHGHPEIVSSIRECLDLDFHAVTHEDATLNTLRYLFFHMRCGIYVMMRQSRLVMFVPFVNKDFTNLWGLEMKIEEPLLDVYILAKHDYTDEKYIMDKVTTRRAPPSHASTIMPPCCYADPLVGQRQHYLQCGVAGFLGRRLFISAPRHVAGLRSLISHYPTRFLC
jgi:hypothetical protein